MSRIQPPSKDPVRPSVMPARAVAAPQVAWNDPSQMTPIAIVAGLVILLFLAYFDMFALTSAAWSDGLYSHGWLVPLFAAGLLWLRWEPFASVPTSERWIGVGLLILGLSVRLFAAKYGMHWLDRLSFLPAIFGVFIMVGGMHVIRWAWPALGFLIFMFPLPSRLEVGILMRLQKFATVCSTFVLQTMGVTGYRQGNLIYIPGLDHPLNVAEACAGLRMATIFIALAVAMVFIIERPWWDKLVILISALPIALLVNIIRIVVTGLLQVWMGQQNEFVNKLGHDWAGFFMMPLALMFLWLELQILERLTVPVESVQLRPVGGARNVSPVPVR